MLNSKREVKDILVIRNDRFGEFLLIIPALRALKAAFPNSSITLAVDSYVAELAQRIDYVDDVIIWDNREHSFKETLLFSNQIRGRGFDLAVVFNPTQESHLACFLAKIPVRLGYDRKMGYLLTHKIRDEKHLANKHEIEYNLDLVGLAGAATNNTNLDLNIEDSDILGSVKGSVVIAVHPWTSDPVKQWPLERFKELTKRLAGLEIVIIGGKEEQDKNPDFLKGLHEIAINLIGKTTLLQLAQVLKKVNLLVSGDSGPVHLAACVGTPVIALFRNDLPGKTAKRWGPWGKAHTVIEKERLIDISVDDVLREINNKLKERI